MPDWNATWPPGPPQQELVELCRVLNARRCKKQLPNYTKSFNGAMLYFSGCDCGLAEWCSGDGGLGVGVDC